jgi:sulfide:quinone oxidoreductase
MKRNHIVVVGSSFAGFTAALELKKRLGDRHDVTVLSKSEQFLFMPSLIWVPFGLRGREDITFDVRAPLERHGVRFRHVEVTRLSLENRTVRTKDGDETYDYLLIATGPKPNYAAVPGLGPRGYTQSIMTLPEATHARTAFERFLDAPGPVVVGAAQGASCFNAAYEFLFNMAHQLKKRSAFERSRMRRSRRSSRGRSGSRTVARCPTPTPCSSRLSWAWMRCAHASASRTPRDSCA